MACVLSKFGTERIDDGFIRSAEDVGPVLLSWAHDLVMDESTERRNMGTNGTNRATERSIDLRTEQTTAINPL